MKLFLGYVGLVVGQSKGREADDQVYQSNQVKLPGMPWNIILT